MGGATSTRRLVVEELDGDGVVKVSESVVRRLKGEGGGERPSNPTSGESKSRGQQSQSGGYRRPAPEVTYVPAQQFAQSRLDTKRAIQEVEAFYQSKLKLLEERNATLQKITNEQFAKAVQEVEQKFLKQTGTPVCQDLQARVYQCYIDNPKHTLLCSSEVGAFTSCVEKARQNALTRKG